MGLPGWSELVMNLPPIEDLQTDDSKEDPKFQHYPVEKAVEDSDYSVDIVNYAAHDSDNKGSVLCINIGDKKYEYIENVVHGNDYAGNLTYGPGYTDDTTVVEEVVGNTNNSTEDQAQTGDYGLY